MLQKFGYEQVGDPVSTGQVFGSTPYCSRPHMAQVAHLPPHQLLPRAGACHSVVARKLKFLSDVVPAFVSFLPCYVHYGLGEKF